MFKYVKLLLEYLVADLKWQKKKLHNSMMVQGEFSNFLFIFEDLSNTAWKSKKMGFSWKTQSLTVGEMRHII